MSHHRHSDRHYHAVADYTLLIREAITEGYDWPIFQALTAPMSKEVKEEVWKHRLTTEEKIYIQALKADSLVGV